MNSLLQNAAGRKQSSLIGPWEKTWQQSIQQFIRLLTDDEDQCGALWFLAPPAVFPTVHLRDLEKQHSRHN